MIAQEDVAQPCFNCSNNKAKLDMRRELCVGFGCVSVVLDGVTVYAEPILDDWLDARLWTVYDAEFRARINNTKDARIVWDGPLWGGTYQRQGEYNWILIEQNEGFA